MLSVICYQNSDSENFYRTEIRICSPQIASKHLQVLGAPFLSGLGHASGLPGPELHRYSAMLMIMVFRYVSKPHTWISDHLRFWKACCMARAWRHFKSDVLINALYLQKKMLCTHAKSLSILTTMHFAHIRLPWMYLHWHGALLNQVLPCVMIPGIKLWSSAEERTSQPDRSCHHSSAFHKHAS